MLDILLVNDDGFDALGIQVLFEALTDAGYNVTFVAPLEQQSGAGTFINTDLIFQPLAIDNFAPNQWSVDASPIVTTWTGLDVILEGNEPDLVISGINEGENVGSSIAISSGTVSAATAATRRGIPAIAVSAGQEAEAGQIEETYEIGSDFVLDVIKELQATQPEGEELLPEGVGLNINIPTVLPEGISEIEEVAFTELDETGTFDIFVGELPPDFGEGTGLLASVNEPISPEEVTDPRSEGQRFLSGAITVTPIDGNWGAGETVRQEISDRVENAPEDPTATPLNILLTNDDGFDAEGIEVLLAALTEAGHQVTLVAPLQQQSGQGTRLDVDKFFQPLTIQEFAPNQFSVEARPRTVTWAGLDALLEETPPDLILSGINEGENIGVGGAVSSGTVSAAVTGLLRGVPAIALSAGIDLSEEEAASTSEAYQIGADFIVETIAQLQATQGEADSILPSGIGLSVNIPVRFPEGVEDVQGVAFTNVDAIEPLIIDVGEIPPEFGGGTGLRFFPNQLPPDAEVDPTSEGGQFLSGFTTVTPIDGDWNADPEASAAVIERLQALPELVARSQLIFGSLEEDELDAEIPSDNEFDGVNDIVFTGEAEDLLDVSVAGQSNRIYAGSDNDEVFIGRSDRVFGGDGDDVLDASIGGGDNRIYGGAGNDDFFLGENDRLIGGVGEDRFFALAGGENVITGGSGTDQFWLANAQFPASANVITDFTSGEDVLGIAGINSVNEFEDIGLTPSGADTLVAVNGNEFARLLGVDSNNLTASDFVIAEVAEV